MTQSAGWVAGLILMSSPAIAEIIIVDNLQAILSDSTQPGGVPILMYHGLDASHNQDPAGFNAQMDYIAANNYRCITLDHLRSWIQTGEPELPEKPVILTFDDNYITVYTHAYPRMKSLSEAGAVIFGYNFAHTAYVGVAPGGSPATSYDHADYNECIQMESDGILFTESHTVSHLNLVTLSDAQETAEILNSKAAIESNMPGKTVRHLSYPFGGYDATTIIKTQNAGYDTGVTVIAGPNTRSTPRFELRRYAVYPNMYVNSDFIGYLNPGTTNTTWTASVGAPGYYGSNYHYANAGTGSSTATWEFTVSSTGNYTVYARWAAAFNRATNAPYTIHHADGSTTMRVDQQSNGGTWRPLGNYNFNGGEPYKIVLSNDADGLVIADAVQIESSTSAPSGWMLF